MPMINGQEGNVTLVGGYTTGVQEWTIRYAADALESSKFTDATRSFVAGLKAWEGSYTCWLDDTQPLVAPGILGAAEFIYSSTGGTGNKIAGDIIVTSIEPTANYEGSSRFVTVNFQGTGAPVIT